MSKQQHGVMMEVKCKVGGCAVTKELHRHRVGGVFSTVPAAGGVA